MNASARANFRRGPAWRPVLASLAIASLAACGGGGGGDSGAPSGSGRQASGVLVMPKSVTASSASQQAVGTPSRAVGGDTACAEVPDGYAPVSGTAIQFEGADGQSLASLTTDTCGRFSGTVPELAVQATAQPGGGQKLTQPVASLVGQAAPVVISGLPTGAHYVLSVLQHLGGDRVALSVTDSLTGKSVLGLTAADLSLTRAGQALGLDGLSYGASQANAAASVSMVMDRSGSMVAQVGQTDTFRQQVAGYAAHRLLDGLRQDVDEAGMVMFGTDVAAIKDSVLAGLSWATPDGQARAPYTFSASGLTRSISSLRPVVDLYNLFSKIYLNSRFQVTDAVHPSTGDWRVTSSYFTLPSGSTSFYDAALAGLAQLEGATNSRRLIVAMTDGKDNTSTHKLADVVTQAKTQGIPVFTVAFGPAADVDEADLQSLAQQTGGDYRRVEGLDLTGVFEGIQTGIRYQYVADLAAALASGQTLTVTVTHGGQSVTRDLLVP